MTFRAQPRRAPARWWTLLAVGGLTAALPSRVVSAQGFGLNELGSCAIARGFAVTSAPCDDASTIYWNPAATTKLTGLSLYGGAAAISVKGAFTADTTGRRYDADVPTEFPPFLGMNWTPESHRYAIGIAAYVPYGLTSQWRPDFIGRFSAKKAALQSVYVQPNIAVDLVPGKLSIGGGPTFGWSQLELIQAIDLAPQTAQRVGNVVIPFSQLGIAPGTEFGQVKLKGSATGVGFNVGAHAQLTPAISLGARYLSKVRFKFDGADATFMQTATGLTLFPGSPILPANAPATPLDAVVAPQFAAGGLLAPGQQARTQIDFPAQFQAGIGYTGMEGTTLSVDYALIQWSSFETLPVDFGTTSPLTRSLLEDYKNSNSIRVGLEHRFGESMSEMNRKRADLSATGIAVRLGFAYAQTPAPDVTVTPLLPDMNRYNFTGGLGIPLGRSFGLDATYLRVETEGRRGRVGDRLAAQTAAQVNTGFYSLSANIFSLSLKAQF